MNAQPSLRDAVPVAVSLVVARAKSEEGRRPQAYNDATGKTVSCQPDGNLTVGYGTNLEYGLDEDEMTFLLQHRVELADEALSKYDWYTSLDQVRASAILDAAYNEGAAKFINGYPHLIEALQRRDWKMASINLTVRQSNVDASRYAPLRAILLNGVDSVGPSPA